MKKFVSALLTAALMVTAVPVGSADVAEAKKTTKKTKTTVEKTKKISNKEGSAKLSKKGYELKWEDNFDGTELNRNDWNVELHEAGWVNSEQQEYVDSEENIEVKDGKLTLKPVKKADGSITSGRVNTMGKHDYKYGIFEAKVKVPKGQGYLPAFWMMPTNENLYGQWPRCGEIDIMEVMGQETNKLYGTIHYGNPHKETQGTKILGAKEKDFYDSYHVFDVEWVPGRITWYCDGVKYHEARDWYTANGGDDPKTFPAPFDQPFYMILNLAVGGSWVGMADDATLSDMENQSFKIDYVRAYQKESYSEKNVEAVSAADNTKLRSADKNGNYIVNGTFSEKEKLDDESGWQFFTAMEGESTAEIKDKQVTIKTTKEGTVDYSMQIVQANLPMKKGATYKLSFDASASENRSMKVAIQGPDQGWIAYMPQKSVSLTTEKQTYTYEFTVTQSTDPNGRLDFNLGAQGSLADVNISNVSLKEVKKKNSDAKTVRADGNYVYNGTFDEGTGRLGNWEILETDKQYVSVTNTDNNRYLKVTAPAGTSKTKPVMVEQSALGLTHKGAYALSFCAYAKASGKSSPEIQISFANVDIPAQKLTGTFANYSNEFVLSKDIAQKKANLTILFTAPGTYYLDDIRIDDNALIKNGRFDADLASWSPYVNAPASASYVVDSLSEDKAFAMTIDDTGADDDSNNWYIQLNQDGVKLESGKKYRLSFAAKSDIERMIQYSIGHNGESDDNWDTYSGYQKVKLIGSYQTFTMEFTMEKATDLKSRFNITLGSVDGKRIRTTHNVYIDNVVLEEI